MSELTHSGGGGNRGPFDNSEHNTPISSRAATPGADGSRPSSGTGRVRAWVGKKYDKGKAKIERGAQKLGTGVKSIFDRNEPKDEKEGESRPQDVGGSAVVGSSDNADVTGGLRKDEEVAAAGQLAPVGTLRSGAAVGTNLSADVLAVSAKEAAASVLQHQAASASPAKDDHTLLGEIEVTSNDPKPGLGEDSKAVTAHGTDVGETSISTAGVTKMELDTTGGAPQTHGAETVSHSAPASNLQETTSSEPLPSQATVASGVTDDEGDDLLKESTMTSTVFAPFQTIEEMDSATSGVGNSSAPLSGMAPSVKDKPMPATGSSSKAWAIAKGSLKTALGIAVTLVPEPFKGPAEVLMKVVDVIEVFVNSMLIFCKLLKYFCIENKFQQGRGKDLEEALQSPGLDHSKCGQRQGSQALVRRSRR
jgi:hypothetical protein